MVLPVLFHLSMGGSPTSTALLLLIPRCFIHLLKDINIVFKNQDWCYTDNGKWGNCNSDCKGGVPGCFKTNVKYSPIDDFPGARRSVETSVEACKARCEADPACEHFSFWAKELPEDNGCTLFGGSAVFGHEKETNDIITGPAACPGEIEFHFHPFFRPFLQGSFSHVWLPQSLFTLYSV